MMKAALDLHRMAEDDQITLIGQSVMDAPASSTAQPPTNGFFVESGAKADRYIHKLQARFPGIRITATTQTAPGVALVKIAGPIARAS